MFGQLNGDDVKKYKTHDTFINGKYINLKENFKFFFKFIKKNFNLWNVITPVSHSTELGLDWQHIEINLVCM